MRTNRSRRRMSFSPTVDGLPSRVLPTGGPGLLDPADTPLDCGDYPTNHNGSYPGDVDPWQTNLNWEHGGGLDTVND